MNEIYLAVINKDYTSGKYEIMFPDVENAITFAESNEQIYEMAEDVLAAVLSVIDEDDFPPVATVSSIMKNLKDGAFIRPIVLNYDIMEKYRKSTAVVPQRPAVNWPLWPLRSDKRRRDHYDKLFKLSR